MQIFQFVICDFNVCCQGRFGVRDEHCLDCQFFGERPVSRGVRHALVQVATFASDFWDAMQSCIDMKIL